MGAPRSLLPEPFAVSSILELLSACSLPLPDGVTLLESTASYHIIYVLSYSGSDRKHVLRVAGPHFPEIKTLNEVAVLSWLERHTTIPVPQVVAYDGTTDNVLGQEWMLVTYITGISFDKLEQHLQDVDAGEDWGSHLTAYMHQMLDVIQQLSIHRWSMIGGLAISAGGEITPAPMINENLWTSNETAQSWSSCPRNNQLNIVQPCHTYTELLVARTERYQHAITEYIELEPLKVYLPLIKVFIRALKHREAEINDTILILAHRDLHFGNVMWDPVTKQITGVLDWEFAAVVPAQRWDPPNAFMYDSNLERTHESKTQRQQAMRLLAQDKGVSFWKKVDRGGDVQRSAQKAVNYLRATIEALLDGGNKPWITWVSSFEMLARELN